LAQFLLFFLGIAAAWPGAFNLRSLRRHAAAIAYEDRWNN
jgi:hypothetical protein